MNRKIKAGVGLLILGIGFIYLIFSGINNFSSYFLTIEEVHAQNEEFHNERIKVSGLIIGESIDWDSQEVELNFKLKHEEGSDKTIAVKYDGIKPDNFEDGQAAIVEGVFSDGEYLEADELLMQCPSRYEAELSDREQHPDEIDIE